MTQPDFSYKRKKDIDGLIREINRRLRIRGETTVFSEQDALKLTLQRYIKREELMTRLNSYDDTLILHYASTQVAFCGGDTVDLRNDDDSEERSTCSRNGFTRRETPSSIPKRATRADTCHSSTIASSRARCHLRGFVLKISSSAVLRCCSSGANSTRLPLRA